MALIRPFRGIRYNQEKISAIKQVVTPPYDVITPGEQEAYYQKNEYNMIRLILGKIYPDDTPHNNRYTRAARDFEDWLHKEILIPDPLPSFYAYKQTYPWRGKRETRWGFLGLARLEDFIKGIILPHESTLASPKVDRLNLLRTCKANLGPIFALYSDPGKKINSLLENDGTRGQPMINLIDPNEVEHSLWVMSQPELVDIISREMAEKQLFIADGHHRYESSLEYHRETLGVGTSPNEDDPSGYIMMSFSNLDDQGLTVLPIHRMLKSPNGFDWVGFEEKAQQHFSIQPIELKDKNPNEILSLMEDAFKEHAGFGMYTGEGKYYLLRLKDTIDPCEVIKEPLPSAWKTLDVTIFQSVLLEISLQMSIKTLKEQEYIGFTHNIEEAVALVDQSIYQWAFFLKPTKLQDIKNVCLAGHKMPQKSTFFYPKLLTGLVLYSFLQR
jgi:uncharacterized protein (DUF1015 family)